MKTISLKQESEAMPSVTIKTDKDTACCPMLFLSDIGDAKGLKVGQEVTIKGTIKTLTKREESEEEGKETCTSCEIECLEMSPGKVGIAKKDEVNSDEEAISKGLDDAEAEDEEGEDEE